MACSGHVKKGMAEAAVRPYNRREKAQKPRGWERRLPMELTGTVTAIMALASFGFVAAIILGMI